ncbi:MAG: TIGR04222 domain-containing membrane protein [Magnetococcales bacterium]|nr:TIGR04222 domain-containing membrane protein [Magnetococcales bacterium]NGZ25898.1 TIGR04222 domain-containing membrane protein [Magnetococcales bacterium]
MEVVLLITVGLWVLWGWWQRNSGPLPTMDQVPPLDLAWLRGGWPSAVQVALFGLSKQNLMELRHEPGSGVVATSLPGQLPDHTPLLVSLLHRHLRTPTPVSQLLNDNTLQKQNRSLLLSQEQPLVAWGLLRGASGRATLLAQTGLAALAIAALLASSSESKQELGSVLLIVGFFLLLVLKPWQRQVVTSRGKRFLRSVNEELSIFVPSLKEGDISDVLVDPLLLVAVYGLTAALPWLPFALPWQELHLAIYGTISSLYNSTPWDYDRSSSWFGVGDGGSGEDGDGGGSDGGDGGGGDGGGD